MNRETLFARAYYRGHRFTSRFDARSAVAVGTWLGLLNEGLRVRIDRDYYSRQPKYFADSWNERGLLDWERAAIDGHFRAGSSVLVTSTGGGRELIALERAGFEVAGCECHQGLISSGNARLLSHGLECRIRPAPRDECPDFGRSFDGAIVGLGSYAHIRGRRRRVRFLRQLCTQLHAGAPVLVSFLAPQVSSHHLRLVARIGNVVGWVFRSDRVEVGDYLMPNFAHFFSENELAAELRDGGFEMEFFRTVLYGHAVAFARSASQDPTRESD